jgi:hypothetical protein
VWAAHQRTGLYRTSRSSGSLESESVAFYQLHEVDMSIHSETTTLLREMELVHQSITSYQPTITKPPILDSSFDTVVDRNSQHLHGLRPLLEAVKRDIDVVKQVPLPRAL